MDIKDLVAQAHENAVQKGFWDPPLEFGTAIALIHSELSEALEEVRAGRPVLYFDCAAGHICATDTPTSSCKDFSENPNNPADCACRGMKPEGVAVELADAVIRIADLCGHMGIDLDAMISLKMEYNTGRPYKHGKQF